jgi:hypothetical protein
MHGRAQLVGMSLLLLATACGGARVPATVGEQRKAHAIFEQVRQAYFDDADIPAAKASLAALAKQWRGQLPEEVFAFQERMDGVQALDLAAATYGGQPDPAACEGELLRVGDDLGRAAALIATSRGAELARLKALQRHLQEAQGRLQGCVARYARSLGQEDRLLAESSDPAVLRPLVQARDAKLSTDGDLEQILPYLRRTRELSHSQALIDRNDQLLMATQDRDLIAAYLFHYADHRHDDLLFLHLDRLFLTSGDWLAVEAYLRRFATVPHLAALEAGLQEHYRLEFEAGARLFDQEQFAEAAGHLAVVAPRSPLYGQARSLLAEAARMGYYRWEQPEVWIMASPYHW